MRWNGGGTKRALMRPFCASTVPGLSDARARRGMRLCEVGCIPSGAVASAGRPCRMGRCCADAVPTTARLGAQPGQARRSAVPGHWNGAPPRRPTAGASRQRPRGGAPIRPCRYTPAWPFIRRYQHLERALSGRLRQRVISIACGGAHLRGAITMPAHWNGLEPAARFSPRPSSAAHGGAGHAGGGRVSRAEAAYGRPTAALCSTRVMSCCGIRWGMTRMSSRRSGRVRGRVRFWEKNW